MTVQASTPALTDLPLKDSVTRDGITWSFNQKTRVGTFVKGDYYVVGPVTIISISPAPTLDPGRNGSVLNIPLDPGISGFDDRVSSKRWTPSIRANLPIKMKPGDALVSSISANTMQDFQPWMREGQEDQLSPVRSYSVLHCLAAPVPADAFRPSYADRGQKIYRAGDLHRELLPKLKRVPSATTDILSNMAAHFRRPWLDICFFSFDCAMEYQPQYAREIGRAGGRASLLLMCDSTPAEKETLLINFVQYGIDLWGIARAGYAGWQAHGGHGSGRKLPIVFAGVMLGDKEMAAPTKTYPDLKFGEDMQTMYGECWTGAKVVYAGHNGVWKGKPVNTKPTCMPYEHLQPAQWPGRMGEDYRRISTSKVWVGEALAIELLGQQANWDYPAFFDYCDRWMTEEDSTFVEIIKQQRGWDYSVDWQRQKQTWDPLVTEMWNTYRSTVPKTKNRN